MEITILATSDMHGFILPTDFRSREQNQSFGTAKVASVIKKLKDQATGPVITIENGDFIQGSPLTFYLAKHQATQDPTALMKALDLIGYDVGLLGNHEFNYGRNYLEKMEQATNHPLLCANILDQSGQSFTGQPYIILEKAGLKIAILGLTTQYIPHWERPEQITGLQFKSALETAKKYVPYLRQQADLVLVSYHGGFERDFETGEPTEALTGENEGFAILQEVSGIDAFITGHQHRKIATVVNNVPVIQPGFRGEFVGKINLTVEQANDGQWSVTKAHSELVPVANEEPAPEIVNTFEELSEKVEAWLDQPLGKVEGSMIIEDPNEARIKEHPYIEFIQKVQMAASGADISATALFNNEGRGFDRTITMRSVVTNYIYPNTLAVLRITGADLKAALEKSASFFQLTKQGEIGINPAFLEPKPAYYNYDMYEGIEYVVDVSKPMGERITTLNYQSRAVTADEMYEVVINQYRAVGGGDYEMFSAEKIVKEIPVDMTELIANYLQKNSVISATTNQNFQVIK